MTWESQETGLYMASLGKQQHSLLSLQFLLNAFYICFILAAYVKL